MNVDKYSSRRSLRVNPVSNLNNSNITRSSNNKKHYKKNSNKFEKQVLAHYLEKNNLNNNIEQTPNSHYPIFVNHEQALKILKIHYYYTNYCNNPAFENSFFYYFHPTSTAVQPYCPQPNNYFQHYPTMPKYPTVSSAKSSYNPLILSYIQEGYSGNQMCNAIKQNSIQNQAIPGQANNRSISAFKPYSRSRATNVAVKREDSCSNVAISAQHNIDQTSTINDNYERINKSFPILKY